MRSARPDRPPATGRALFVAGTALVAGAIVVGALALRPSSAGDEVVLDVVPVSAATVPDTVPVLPPPTTSNDADGAAAANTGPEAPPPVTSPPGIELSPLAELLGVPGSAIPPVIEPRVRPRSVTIGEIELWGPVRAVGLEDDGQLEVPDETEIGWYRYGSSPGRAGATVLAAHVTWNGSLGPFFKLGELDPGDRVDVRLEDDSLRTYEVIERTIYDKQELPRERIWRTTGDETLVLITCGGSFNPDINRYRQNIVVYAVPVDSEPPPAR